MKSIYLTTRFYLIIAILVLLFLLGFWVNFVFILTKLATILFVAFATIDIILLYGNSKNSILATRQLGERFSNGDKNRVLLSVKSFYGFKVNLRIIDEIPFQFQERNFLIISNLSHAEERNFEYYLKPLKRGEYHFGKLNVFVISYLGLISRRYKFNLEKTVKVYPSFIQMRKYEILAISNNLTEVGIKKIRRISSNQEFEQIKEYVKGDDSRTVNWKATARRSKLMVNQYQDEKSQQVISLIDMGRTMQMPFEGMSLLDYAINSSLIISNIAIYKQDKAGIITFTNKIGSALLPEKRNNQIIKILEVLYRQLTNFAESDFENLYTFIKRNIKQRSLLLLYTNFESYVSLGRQMDYFKKLAGNHLLVIIFFENTELKHILLKHPKNIEDIYIKTTAEKFAYEKKLIVKELNKYGIHTLLTEPANLNIATINKYLQLKALGLI